MRGALTGSGGAIVAVEAGTRHPGMIEIHRGPIRGDVAVITHIAGR